MQEGTTWEGALLAGHHNLSNLVVLVDFNKWTAMGRTVEVSDLEPFDEKWEAFNWYAHQGDGHDYAYIDRTIRSKNPTYKPLAFIYDTIKGKGT